MRHICFDWVFGSISLFLLFRQINAWNDVCLYVWMNERMNECLFRWFFLFQFLSIQWKVLALCSFIFSSYKNGKHIENGFKAKRIFSVQTFRITNQKSTDILHWDTIALQYINLYVFNFMLYLFWLCACCWSTHCMRTCAIIFNQLAFNRSLTLVKSNGIMCTHLMHTRTHSLYACIHINIFCLYTDIRLLVLLDGIRLHGKTYEMPHFMTHTESSRTAAHRTTHCVSR